MENNSRPLSPHLQIYRLPLTGLISITHRATGILLSGGLVLFVISLIMINCGQASYTTMQNTIALIPAQIVIWGMIYSLFFHLCHGVRHLIWDAGKGFELEDMNKYAVIELLSSVVLTSAAFFLSF